MTMLRPADLQELSSMVAEAASRGQKLEIAGGGSKQGLGRFVPDQTRLDLAALSGILEYEPAELRLTALAATTIAEIEARLETAGQMLAFEPAEWWRLYGDARQPTLGGVIACNISGPRRVRAGAARDHFLGFSAVDGMGTLWQAGGKVVKNVTGYDMGKLLCGAFGTLSVLAEVTVRTMPKPETGCTLAFHGLSDAQAVSLLSDALNSPFEVSAAAHLPVPAARRLKGGPDGSALTVLRLEGHAPSVAYRAAALTKMLSATDRLAHVESEILWREIGTVRSLLPAAGRTLWRLCPPQAAAAAIVANLTAHFPEAEAYYDWGGGLIWLSLSTAPDGGAGRIRAALRKTGGHATLTQGTEAIRASVPVFEPAPGPIQALSQRLKTNFDPLGILNPGRMHEGY